VKWSEQTFVGKKQIVGLRELKGKIHMSSAKTIYPIYTIFCSFL